MPETNTPLLANCNGAGCVDLFAVIALQVHSQRRYFNAQAFPTMKSEVGHD